MCVCVCGDNPLLKIFLSNSTPYTLSQGSGLQLGFLPTTLLHPRGHFAMSGDIFAKQKEGMLLSLST